jgi:hypothetical protein
MTMKLRVRASGPRRVRAPRRAGTS